MIESVERFPGYLLLRMDHGLLRLEPYLPSALRITFTGRKAFRQESSRIVLPDCREPVAWDFRETDGEVVLSTEQLQVHVDTRTGALTYLDTQGTLLAREPARGGRTLEEIDVVKAVYDETSEAETAGGVDGIKTTVRGARHIADRKAYHAKLEFEWAEGEALYGLGSHEEGMMNLRGQHQYLYQQNMKAVVPVLLSTNGYGVLLDCESLMVFHDDAFGSYFWCDVVEELDYYFIYGHDFDEIIQIYRKLTGRAPMLPRWAFGYMQSKERYRSQEELIEVASEYRRRGIPLDTMILDWKSWPGDLWGQKTLDPERFPDPDGMMERLHAMNVKLMISIWPNMSAGGDNREFLERGLMLGDQTHYDPYGPEGRELYWKQADEGLFRHGIDAWWCDCSEPFEADWRGPVKPEPEERMRINTGEAKKFLDPAEISSYSLLHAQGIYEGQRSVTDRKRVVNLTRSSYAGQHRYSTVTWSGDIAAYWETLRKQIPAGLNFCASGEPYWTLDIGAFFAGGKGKWSYWCKDPSIPAPWFLAGDYDGGVDDLGYRELYVRWFQYAAFLPVFRAHGTDTPREVWRFGEPGGVFYDTLMKFIRLRYRLLPYIYSLAGMTTFKDYTMMRALAFDFREDHCVYGIADQYMFGPALMVCPVTNPMYYGPGSEELRGVPRTRPVYLPAGCDWYDFWSGERYEGGQSIEAAAPLDSLPLFVRAGSVIPMAHAAQSADESVNEPLEIRVYPGADGAFVMYEDEGDNYDYEKGSYTMRQFTWHDGARKLSLEEAAGGMPRAKNRRMYATLVSKGRNCGIDAVEPLDGCFEHSGKMGKHEIRL
jgi:alpha-D-xyloside xylohydrolase